MGKCEELLERASKNPKGIRFRDLCRLAECHGFVLSRTRGSHRIFRHPKARKTISFQEAKGMAKPYQVRQLLGLILDVRDDDG